MFLSNPATGLPSSLAADGSGNLTLTARWIQSTNGAVNAPPHTLTGGWFTSGGTAETTKPQFLIEPSGTTSASWNTAGTGLGVNAPSGFGGSLLDLQVNGATTLNIAREAGNVAKISTNLAGAINIHSGGQQVVNIEFNRILTFKELLANARIAVSANGAVSAPPMALTGTWFTGGTSTTTKPQFLIEPAGTTSASWSTAGTGFGVNAPSGSTGKLIDAQLNGVSQFAVDAASSVGVTCIRLQASNRIDATNIVAVGASTNIFSGSYQLGVSGNMDTILTRDAANTFAQRNGTAAQISRIYNTFTDASNFERLNIRWTSNEAIIDTEAGSGGGTLRGLRIGSAATSLLGFYTATPIAQPAAVADATDAASVITQLNLALARLRTLGLIAT